MNIVGHLETAATQPDRYHALDSLRGFAMFLGILIHAVISFMAVPPSFWPVRDNDRGILADLFVFAVHDFRMQTFFLLAGFFGCLLYQRYGFWGMLRHRFRRIVVPFALSVLFLVPPLQAIWLASEIETFRAEGVPSFDPSPVRLLAANLVGDSQDSTAEIVWKLFLTGEFVGLLAPFHLWFLYYLIWCFAVMAVILPLTNRIADSTAAARFDRCFRWLVESRARVWLVPWAILPLMYTMKLWLVDTPTGWMPQGNLLLYYFGFFAFGWVLYRQRDLVASFGRGWKWLLAVANMIVLPAMIGMSAPGMEAVMLSKATGEPLPDWIPVAKFGAFLAASYYTWMMILGLWGLFLTVASTPRVWVRYLADASYWCYIASLGPTILLQLLVAQWSIPGPVKLVFIVVMTMAILLVSYEWCVRYTFIGAVLNGRKTRGMGMKNGTTKKEKEEKESGINVNSGAPR